MFALCFLNTLRRVRPSSEFRADPLLQADRILSNYGAASLMESQRQITDIPAECWSNCLQFASSRHDVLNTRLISRQYSKAYEEFMDSHQTTNLCHLLDPNVQNRKYQTLQDIQKSILLMPGASIDLSSNCCMPSLRRFHERSNIYIVRGLDASSKHDFLSILLRNEDDLLAWKLLWICKFDERGMNSSHLYLFVGDDVVPEYDGPDIIALQLFLVEEHCVMDNLADIGSWTVESESKQRCRKIRESIRPRCDLCWLLWLLLFVWWVWIIIDLIRLVASRSTGLFFFGRMRPSWNPKDVKVESQSFQAD